MKNTKILRSKAVARSIAYALACTAVLGLGNACSSSKSSDQVESATSTTVEGGGTKRVAVKESALALFEQATAESSKNPANAKALLEKAIGEDKGFAEAWFNLGILHERDAKTDDAIKAYENAIKIRPDWPNGYVNLGEIYVKQGKVAEAEKLFLKVVDEKSGLDPYNAQANLNMGMIYRKRGVDIIERDSGGVEPEFTMSGTEDKGVIKNKEANAQFSEAVRYVRRALAGDSNNIYCYENLSAIYYMMNSLEVARLVNDQAVQKQIERNAELDEQLKAGTITQYDYDSKRISDKSMGAVYNTSGLIYLASGSVAMANAEFKKAVAADPTLVDAWLNVAGIAVNVQDYPTAYEAYNKVLALQPDNVEAYLSKGVAARGLNKLDEAETIYRDIIKKHPNYPAAAFNLAILYQEYYLKLEEAKKMLEQFAANSEAQKQIPGRVKEAQTRVKQIEDIWAAQKKAEEDMKKMNKMMEEMEKLQKAQEAEAAQQAPEPAPAP